MMSSECLRELRTTWLPHVTESGLARLVELLEQGSPLLIRGSFTRAVPQGCLATQIAWHHPATEHLTMDAGIHWLSRVAKLNPATSLLVRAWDNSTGCDFELRRELLAELGDELRRREISEEGGRMKDGAEDGVAELCSLSAFG